MDSIELVLLYDYYGDLLTDRQKECFEMRYYQDLSLGEIGDELGISRQGVHDNLSRGEALLRNMKQKQAASVGTSLAGKHHRSFWILPGSC